MRQCLYGDNCIAVANRRSDVPIKIVRGLKNYKKKKKKKKKISRLSKVKVKVKFYLSHVMRKPVYDIYEQQLIYSLL